MENSTAIKKAVAAWARRRDGRSRLQHAYLVITVLNLVTSGVVSLVNDQLGRNLTYISLGAFGVFLANMLVWAILNSVLESLGVENHSRTIAKK